LIKLHIQQDERAITYIAVVKHDNEDGSWSQDGKDYYMSRTVNEVTGNYWFPVIEGQRVPPYFVFSEAFGLETHPSPADWKQFSEWKRDFTDD
jgi:uncharacterized protein (UPF0128 family)